MYVDSGHKYCCNTYLVMRSNIVVSTGACMGFLFLSKFITKSICNKKEKQRKLIWEYEKVIVISWKEQFHDILKQFDFVDML